MAAARKVIITCAVTGSGHTPTMSPHLPYTVEDVVAQSVAAAEAGAAVIHLHARDPKDGSPTADPAVFLEYLKAIKAETDAVISITSGGGTGMSVTDRLRVIYETKPELCTLNLGTFNYGSFPMIRKYAGKWKFDWEEPYLESTRSEPFVSTFADIEHMLTDAAAGDRLPLRVRGLRRRPPLHAGLLPSARPGGAADLPADDHGRDGRHRRPRSSTSRT